MRVIGAPSTFMACVPEPEGPIMTRIRLHNGQRHAAQRDFDVTMLYTLVMSNQSPQRPGHPGAFRFFPLDLKKRPNIDWFPLLSH
jgi:hypothetical protein